jgi:hypothetical protein
MKDKASYLWGRPSKADVRTALARGIREATLLLSTPVGAKRSTWLTRVIQVLAEEKESLVGDSNLHDISFTRIVPEQAARKRLYDVLDVETIADLWRVENPSNLRRVLRYQITREVVVAMHPQACRRGILGPRKKVST